MFLTSFPAGAWQANCYVLAADDAAACVVVDPGMDAVQALHAVLAQKGLEPAGVLLTHGHLDHVASAAQVADEFGVPAWLHPADRELLVDPLAGFGPQMAAFAAQFGLPDTLMPTQLNEIAGGDEIEVAGLGFRVLHAPGHRPGCVMFDVRAAGASEPVVLTGDVVFAGSIGRTDLPGGDHRVMVDTLDSVVLGLRDATTLLPGHGPASTMQRERRTNPYLQPSYLKA